MLKENEVVMLILGIGVLFLILLNFDHIKRIKSWKILVTSYIFLLCGWIFTVLEGFVLESFFNFSEHTCYFVSALLILIWSVRITEKKSKEDTV